jgi:predicted nucleic acid-binding protein
VRIFLDANILFSAAKSAGAVRELLAQTRTAGHVLCADEYVVAEARRTLETKGDEALSALEALLSDLELAPFQTTELPPDLAALVPEKDRPVLGAAVRLQCEALVTGDRMHFGALYGKCIRGVAIHSPRSLWEALSAAR